MVRICESLLADMGHNTYAIFATIKEITLRSLDDLVEPMLETPRFKEAGEWAVTMIAPTVRAETNREWQAMW